MNQLALIVHGGAWSVAPELVEQCRHGVRLAVDRGWAVLNDGGSSIDACEQAIIELEEAPVFDAGIGSHLNRDGKAQLDAILMNGVTLKSGAIACVEHIRNPIQVARLVMEKSDHMLFAGYGAEEFAKEHGVSLCDPSIFRIASEFERWKIESSQIGTVGAVAVDGNGNLAAGTSTGGTPFKKPGRVGDAPLVGCGCYADNAGAAVSATGHGESIMKVVMAKMVNDLVASGQPPQAAAEAAVARLGSRTGGRAGLIALDRQGRAGVAFSTRNLVHAIRTSSIPAPIVIV